MNRPYYGQRRSSSDLRGFPRYALGTVVIERRQAVLEFGLLCGSQLHLVVVEAVPKLGDQCKPFIRGQTRDFVMSELHRCRLLEAKSSDNGGKLSILKMDTWARNHKGENEGRVS
jgi:hypothetical protein